MIAKIILVAKSKCGRVDRNSGSPTAAPAREIFCGRSDVGITVGIGLATDDYVIGAKFRRRFAIALSLHPS